MIKLIDKISLEILEGNTYIIHKELQERKEQYKFDNIKTKTIYHTNMDIELVKV